MKAKALLLLSVACSLAMAQRASRRLLEGEIQIHVRDRHGVVHAVELPPGAQAGHIRAAMSTSDVPPNYSFVHGGRQLEDQDVLEEVGVGAEAAVEVAHTEIVCELKPLLDFEDNADDLLWLSFVDETERTAVVITKCSKEDTVDEIIKHVLKKYDGVHTLKQSMEYEVRSLKDSEEGDIRAEKDDELAKAKIRQLPKGKVVRVYYGDLIEWALCD